MTYRASLAAASTLAIAVAFSAQAQTTRVSDIQVEADLTAVTSPAAAQYWGTLDADLSAALASEFVDLISPDGLVLIVDLDEISLASLLEAQAGGDDARLTGDVGLYNARTEEVERMFTISAATNEVAPFRPAGADVVTISPTSAEFYDAVVKAFARGVSETVRTGGDASGRGPKRARRHTAFRFLRPSRPRANLSKSLTRRKDTIYFSILTKRARVHTVRCPRQRA